MSEESYLTPEELIAPAVFQALQAVAAAATAPSVEYMSVSEASEQERDTGRAVNRYRAPIEFDVFEPSGDYLGRVWTPVGFSLNPRPIFRDDSVWAVTRDELGVERVHRFGIRPVRVEGDG